MTARRRFGASERSVGAARRFVARTIIDAPADVRESVSLIVSELSTNALVHAASEFDVFVDRSDSAIFVSVSDRGDGTPILQSPESSDPHGRGLRIVDALSDEWGISSTSGEGKTVWFRMSLRASGTDGSAGGVAGSAMIDPGVQGDQPATRPTSPRPTSEDRRAGAPSSRTRGHSRLTRVSAKVSAPRRHLVQSAH